MEAKKKIEELGDELCEHCPLPTEIKGDYCEGNACGRAYELYLEYVEECNEPPTVAGE